MRAIIIRVRCYQWKPSMSRQNKKDAVLELPAQAALASAVAIALTSAPALAEPTSPTPDIVVTGQPLPHPTPDKSTAPLIDTPKSVTVISQALIAETGSTNLVYALRTVPGIAFHAVGGRQRAGDNLRFRGVAAGWDVFIDGVRDAGSQTRDVFALEQIEVIKGPGSTYTGRGSTGGSVNLVTKKPRAEDFSQTSVGAGTDNYGRAALDANYRFGDSMGFRLNVLA